MAHRVIPWSPTRIDTLSGAPARPPAGAADVERPARPTVPFPLSSVVSTLPGSTNHIVSISVENPFTLTLSATVANRAQGFRIVDDGGAQLIGDALMWTEVHRRTRALS